MSEAIAPEVDPEMSCGAVRVNGIVLRRTVVSVLAAGLLAASPAFASWRCGSRVVDAGQSIEDVYDRCGEPTERVTSVEFVTVHLRGGVDVTRAVPVEVWTYDRGPRQFVRYLTFRDGRLVDIDEGGYGY